MTELQRKKKAMAYLIKNFPKKYKGRLWKVDGKVTEIHLQELRKGTTMHGYQYYDWVTIETIKMSEAQPAAPDDFQLLKLKDLKDFKIFIPFF